MIGSSIRRELRSDSEFSVSCHCMLIDFGAPSGETGTAASPLTGLTHPNEEEEEIDDRTAEEILFDLNRIDEDMMRIRFDQSLSDNAILDQLVELMEQRNTLSDKLQRARGAEYKRFVESLDLKKLHIVPFFPAARKCKLQINDDDVSRLVNYPPQPKKKAFGKYEAPPGIAGENFHHCEDRMKQVSAELDLLQRKKYLSPLDSAKKLSLEAEVAELLKFVPRK